MALDREKNSSSVVRLRPAKASDAQQVFAWRNDPWLSALGTTGRPVSWEEHGHWFQETIAGHRRRMFIILHNDLPIGQVRFDRVDNYTCEVSIYLAQEYTGRGLGVMALREACEWALSSWGVDRILARVRSNNLPSLSAFRKAGFSDSSESMDSSRQHHVELQLTQPIRVPHNRLTFGNEETQAVASVVSGGHWAAGPRLNELESVLAERAHVAYCVGTGSGLAALRLALKGLGVAPGDEVIVPAYSCVALANATLALGAKVVPVDIRTFDWNLDPASAREAITTHTRATVLVNTFGAPAPIEALKDLGIPLVEDCAHGFGLKIGDTVLGSRGEAAVLSLHATKLIGGGEGGAVLTSRRDLAEFVRSWRDYTDQCPDGTRLNDKMNDLEAALAICQLRRLDAMLAARERAALLYNESLTPLAQSTGAFRLPDPSKRRVWYRYVLEMASSSAFEVTRGLRKYGVRAESPVTDWRPIGTPPCPVADHAYERLVSLPLFPTLALEEQEIVCNALAAVIKGARHA